MLLGIFELESRGFGRSQGIFGGPTVVVALAQEPSLPLMTGVPSVSAGGTGMSPSHQEKIVVLRGGSVSGALVDASFLPERGVQGNLVTYEVKRGDTLSGIARDFGISVQTIIDANPTVRTKTLKIGQELTILPVSGIAYTVQEGETAETIAALFGLQSAQLKEFNRSVNLDALSAGSVIVIPGARQSLVRQSRGAALPEFKGYFAQPVQGFNWGKLHEKNAVDIANACGTPVTASAEGLVTDLAEGWNSGYGSFVLIEHPNGTKTRYAHLAQIERMLGDYVNQGSPIGTVGNTGNVHGPTGCHLHFEVEGAQNPFVK